MASSLLIIAAMEDKIAWWQTLAHAGKNIRKNTWIAVGVIAFALVGLAAWSALKSTNHGSWPAQDDQETKIRDLEDRVARLQRDLDEASRQIASLQPGAAETRKERRSEQRRETVSRREPPRQADQIAQQTPSLYETARNTTVYEEPSFSSRKVATIPRGSRVRVVGSTGEWLEVRSKQGRPPGFVLKEDAVLAR